MTSPQVLVDSLLALVPKGGSIPPGGYAVDEHGTLWRNGEAHGVVDHLVLASHGTEVHYRTPWTDGEEICRRPTGGWQCWRQAGHGGPCAPTWPELDEREASGG